MLAARDDFPIVDPHQHLWDLGRNYYPWLCDPNQPPRRSMTVVLKRGMTRNIEMSAWHELVLLGDIAAARRNIAIVAYAHDGKPVARYHLTAAWPSKVNISTLKAGSSEVLLETVTITCEFIQRVSV